MINIIKALLILLIICFKSLLAQSPFLKNYTIKDGLPSNEIYEVFQDSKGYIWVATDKGVARFDGYEFKVLTKKDGLTDNTIFGFYEDLKKRMWFRCMNGKICYLLNDKLHTLKCSESLSKIINTNTITSLYVDKSETLWLGLLYSEPYKIDLKNETFSKQKIPQTASRAVYIYEVENSYVWGNTWLENNTDRQNNYYLYLLGQKNKAATKIDVSATKKVPAHYYNKVCKFNHDYYYFSTNTIIKFGSEGIDSILNLKATILAIYKNKNLLLAGYEKKGISSNSNLKEELTFLQEKSISSILKDKEGNFWFSSLNHGLFFTTTLHVFNKPLPIEFTDKQVNTIAFDSNKSWIGFENGFALSEKNSKKFHCFNLNFDSKISNKISKINCFNSGDVAISCDKSLIIKNSKLNYFTADGWKQVFTKDIFNINNCYYLIGKNKIYICDKESYKEKTNINLNTIINAACYDGNFLWIATNDGLWKLADQTAVKVSSANKDINFRIDAIDKDKYGNIYLASNELGLFIYRKNKLYSLDKSFQNKFYSCIYAANNQVIWAACNKGLFKILFSSYEPIKYKVSDFNQIEELASNSINQINQKNDTVYLATDKGIISIDDKKQYINTTTPPIYLSKIKINDNYCDLKDNYSLSYNQNYLNIHFVGLTFKNSGKTTYKYRLMGLDSNWSFTQFTSVNYTTLPYGAYTFEVLAQNNNGYWSQKPARFNFIIAPPFWHTWWFRILAALSLTTGIFLLIKARINSIEKREMEKTALFKKTAEIEKEKSELFQKAADLELQFLSSQMNPHFTFNSMNSIQYFLMKNDTKKAQQYLVKYSKLIRLVLENTMQKTVLLENEIQMLSLYLQIESMRFTDKFEFEILIAEDLKEKKIKIPPMIIQPYVENAIWHGIMNKKNELGKIKLSFSLSENMLKCIIEDDGIGRKKAKEINTSKNNQSLGLLISSSRLEKMQPSSTFNKTVIIDKHDQNGKPCGTRVELIINAHW